MQPSEHCCISVKLLDRRMCYATSEFFKKTPLLESQKINNELSVYVIQQIDSGVSLCKVKLYILNIGRYYLS